MSSSFAPAAPAANQPGEFTRLFGTFSATEASAPPPPAPRVPEPYSGGGPGSFTRMLSLEQNSEPMAPVYREEASPVRTGMDYGLTPASPQAQSGISANDPAKDIFWQPPAETVPVPESTPAAGVGITKLIQMLDAPVRQEARPMPPAAAPPAGGGPGVWTQTFASLSSAAPPAAAPPAPQSWQPPVAPAMPGPPPSSSGPSEFTRILDASKMREQAMKGGAPSAPAGPPAAPAQGFAPMPPMQMPAFQAPPMPQVPPMPQAQPMGGMKPMPHPGGFAPPPMPGGFAAPQMPAPQLPAVQAPPAGKLQQMVPMLLVVAIVLLVVVLVTVIFLLKK